MNLNQVTLPSLNLPRSVAFYKTLGLKLIVDALPEYVRFECPDGAASFSLRRVDRIPEGEGIHIYFECDDLDKEVSRLTQKNLTFDLMPTNQRWLWREARLKDPDGNQLILYHAGENRLNPPWRIKE